MIDCDPDLFSFNQFMTIEQWYTTVASIADANRNE